jgi:hypothetical protein
VLYAYPAAGVPTVGTWNLVAGDNGTLTLTNTSAYACPNGVRITQGVTGLVPNPISRIRGFLAAAPSGIGKIEAVYRVNVESANATYGFDSRVDTGLATVVTGYRVAYDAAGVPALQLQTGDATWTTVGLATDCPAATAWAKLTLGFNLSTLRYTTLIVNARVIDVSAIAIPVIASSGRQSNRVDIRIDDTLDNGAQLDVGQIIFRVQ